jgi:hypothetical protein
MGTLRGRGPTGAPFRAGTLARWPASNLTWQVYTASAYSSWESRPSERHDVSPVGSIGLWGSAERARWAAQHCPLSRAPYLAGSTVVSASEARTRRGGRGIRSLDSPDHEMMWALLATVTAQ